MAQAICRCGQTLTLPTNPDERVVCSGCGARVRVRRQSSAAAEVPGDDFIRFLCECGRRLKVPSRNRPSHGQCPDCGRIVPVPEPNASNRLPAGHPETPTAELDVADQQSRDQWVSQHQQAASAAGEPPFQPAPVPSVTTQPEPSTVLAAPPSKPARVEHGLRTCPACRRPVHIQAETCRGCGAAVPRR